MAFSTYTKAPLSSSPFGRSIAVTGTTQPGALIHIPSFSQLDEIYLYAQNNGASGLTVNLLWGGTTVYDLMQSFLPAQSSRTMLVDGKLLTGTGTIGAYLSTHGTVAIDGFVNRITPGIDPRVVDWANRVIANGGATPSVNTQQVLSTFVQGLTSAGLLYKIVMLNCMVPDSLTACLTPLIRGAGYDLWINHSFVSGDLSINGLTGDGSTKYIDTGFTVLSGFSSAPTQGLGFTLYCSNNQGGNTATSQDLLINDTGAANTQTALIIDNVGQAIWDALDDNVGFGRLIINNPNFVGYFQGSYGTLDGTTTQAIYTGNPNPNIGHKVLISTTATTVGFFNTKQPIYFFAGDLNGSPVGGSYTARTHSFMAAHYGMKQAESQTFFNLIQAMRVGLGGGYINPDPVADWVARVVRNGGATPSANTQSALTTFFNGLVSNNLLAKMKTINVVAPDNLTAAITPFWNVGGGIDPWINHNFVSGDLTVNGLIGNGSNKYLDTGMAPSLCFASNSDGGLTVYVAANSTNANESDFNVSQATPGQCMALYPNFGGTAFLDMYSQNAGSGRLSASNSGFTGYCSGNHGTLGGGVIEAIYTGNSGSGHTTLVSSTTSVGGSLPTQNLYAFCGNNLGSPGQFSVKRLSFFAIHSGLTATESSNFYTLVQALRTAFGGGFV